MADTQQIEILCEELGIPLPTRAAQTRATLDALSVLDVSMQPELSRANLAAQVRGLVERGEKVDVVAMVRANRANADNAEAASVLQVAVEDAERLHELALRGGGGLIQLRAAIAEVYVKVRTLPSNTPTDAFEAVHADEKALAAFKVLEGFANRHSKLRQLHRLLIADDVAQDDALILFADTKRKPDAIPSRIQEAVPAGPREAFARVKWLARPEAETWVPTASELNARYQEFVVAISNRLTGVANKEK